MVLTPITQIATLQCISSVHAAELQKIVVWLFYIYGLHMFYGVCQIRAVSVKFSAALVHYCIICSARSIAQSARIFQDLVGDYTVFASAGQLTRGSIFGTQHLQQNNLVKTKYVA